MGYYVHTEDCTLRIPAPNLAVAWARFVQLNDRLDLQHYLSETERGFSFLPTNFIDHYKNAQEVLEALGFECHTNEADDLFIDHYNGKAGQEDLFLFSLDGLMEGYIEWMGEDASTCRYTFTLSGPTISEDGQTVWVNPRTMRNPLEIPAEETTPYTSHYSN